jgi:hypothetical protein
MAIYIDLDVQPWSQGMGMGILRDALDIAGISIDQDAQVIDWTPLKVKIELVSEGKMERFYYTWEHIQKYISKMYAGSVSRIDMDDSERAVS